MPFSRPKTPPLVQKAALCEPLPPAARLSNSEPDETIAELPAPPSRVSPPSDSAGSGSGSHRLVSDSRQIRQVTGLPDGLRLAALWGAGETSAARAVLTSRSGADSRVRGQLAVTRPAQKAALGSCSGARVALRELLRSGYRVEACRTCGEPR